MLRETFTDDADFELLQLRDYEAELNEGERHRGRSALIGLVARRL